jgi:type II secretory pathway component PulF
MVNMLNLIGKFLYNYGWIILVAMVMAFKFYRTYKQKGKEALLQELRESLYALFLEAEKRYGKAMAQQS